MQTESAMCAFINQLRITETQMQSIVGWSMGQVPVTGLTAAINSYGNALNSYGGYDVGNARSRALLIEHLHPTQRKEFEETQKFTLVSRSGRLYRITSAHAWNVEELDSRGHVLQSLCATFNPRSGWLPAYDLMLAQKLMLETDEQRFHQIANHSQRMGF